MMATATHTIYGQEGTASAPRRERTGRFLRGAAGPRHRHDGGPGVGKSALLAYLAEGRRGAGWRRRRG
jgi:hypothetical protein